MSVYAVSDLHGNYPLWQQIKDFLQPEDTLYVLGDCADRGSKGWQIITEVYEDPRCIYIKGNHEDMLVDVMCNYLRCEVDDRPYFNYDKAYQLSRMNGGEKTFKDWKHSHHNGQWLRRLDELPLFQKYVSPMGHTVMLTHAGYTPDGDFEKKDLLWDRHHFFDEWPQYEDSSTQNMYIVHGHTPVPYLQEDLSFWFEVDDEVQPGMYRYCDGHKIDIDCGAHFTDCTTLLDLDTFEQHIFKGENCVYED